MDLVVPLNQQTFSEIAGWVQYYEAHPELIGKPNTAPQPPWNGQTKIVFNDTSAELYHAIAAQFKAGPTFQIIELPDCPGNSTNQFYTPALLPGQILTFKAKAGNYLSGSVSSGQPVLLFGSGPTPGSFETGGDPEVKIAPGQYGSIMLKPSMAPASGLRYSIRT
jgi:hypothetical protein